MQIRCSGCQKILRVTAQASPIRVKCPACGAVLQVPSATAGRETPEAVENLFADLPSEPSAAPNPFPPVFTQPSPTGPAGQVVPSRAAEIAATKRRFPIWGFVLIAAVVLVAAPMLCCGVIGLWGMSRMKGTPAVVMSEGLRSIPTPTLLPELGQPVLEFPSGVTMYRVSLRDPGGMPGASMQMRVYLPAGEHANGSVPCVLVAPAGTPLLYGADLEGDEYHDETLPYSEAGMVVVHYSIDGAIPPSVDLDDEQAYSAAMAAAFPKFKQSGGGIVNGRNALEYALARIPMIDPGRMCAAGHSSAGTLALVLAATEPRITHCAAYAPAYDCESRMSEAIDDPITRLLLPGIKEFIQWYSPMNHIQDFTCKMMVFHAGDDNNVPLEDAIRFVGALKGDGKTVEFVQVDHGGHYDSMVEQGIPAAIDWLE